jgi:hypothetical protein
MKDPHDCADVKLPRIGLDLDDLLTDLADGRTRAGIPTGPFVGEVLDTHHPHRPGRVLVQWQLESGECSEEWLHPTAQVRPRIADRVLLQRPTNDCEWIVTAVLQREPQPPQPIAGDTTSRLRLHGDEALRIEASDGTPLLEIQSSERGPILRVLGRDLELAVAGRLRLAADTIECVSGQGGTHLRSDGETVVRSPRIRLN